MLQKNARRRPDDAKAHSALGLLLQEEGQLDLWPEQSPATALRFQPDLAVAHVTLGSHHEKMGDFAAAEAEFPERHSTTVRLDARLARLAMLLRGKLPEADCKAIEATAR